MPPEKRSKTGKAKSGRKADRPKGGRTGVGGRGPKGALLIVWVLAVVLLASLIYLGKETRRLPAPLPTGLPSQKAENSPGPPAPEEAGARQGKDRPSVEGYPESKTDSSSSPKYSAVEPPLRRDVPPTHAAPQIGSPLPNIAPRSAMASIVIDDLGPNLEIAKQFACLPFRVTFSVLPHQAHSREIAELAHLKGLEVILHMPMEPLDRNTNPGKGALLVSMSGDEIRRNISAALDTSPYFDGVNNHMGSRMTRDVEMMKIVLSELKTRDLLFLDSMTTGGSKAWQVARELKMSTLKRDIFLDDNPSAGSIRSQISRLVKIARLKGAVLAIGHPRAATLKSLQDAGGYFRKEGVEIVSARELAARLKAARFTSGSAGKGNE